MSITHFNIKTYILLFAFLVVVSACSEDEPTPLKYEVDAEIKPYVERFFELALERGLELDESNLIAELQENLNSEGGQPVCGTSEGPLNNSSQHLMRIDPQCLAWTFDDSSREILVFHELGHLFLLREHKDEIFDNNDYKSIMFGGNWNVLLYYTQNSFKREYYIEELFDPKTPTPDWVD